MKKILTTFLVLCIFILASNSVKGATELSIEGNGSGSQTSVIINSGSSTSYVQGNNAILETNINASANTGGNSVSGNSDGNSTIVTGDSSVEVKVINSLNNNSGTTDCCKNTPTAQPTRTLPTPTPDPGHTSTSTSSTSSSSSQSSSSSPSTAIGGGEVLGLSGTSGDNKYLFQIVGLLCLSLSATYLFSSLSFLKKV